MVGGVDVACPGDTRALCAIASRCRGTLSCNASRPHGSDLEWENMVSNQRDRCNAGEGEEHPAGGIAMSMWAGNARRCATMGTSSLKLSLPHRRVHGSGVYVCVCVCVREAGMPPPPVFHSRGARFNLKRRSSGNNNNSRRLKIYTLPWCQPSINGKGLGLP